jgi:transcriptional regulator with XRE-family HTH domain
MGQKKRTQPEKLKIKLKTIRVKMEVSQQKMVELLSYYAPNEVIVPGYISDFEAGKREPSLIVLLAYSKLTGVSINVLVDDELELPKGYKSIRNRATH